MNEPGAFEPFVDNIESILKREIATPIMYKHLKYNKIVAYANRKIFGTLKNAYANPMQSLRQPCKTTPKATSSLRRV